MNPKDEQPTEPGDDEAAYFAAHAPGDRIADRYQLIRVLDKGGMGVVWVAHHLGLDVQVALKLIHPSAGSRAAAARLVREAQAAARIDHPAVLRVLDVGSTSDGDPFLVMELLDGEPLSDVLERERTLDPVAAVRTLLPIADGLVALHDKGIIHRDIKPENIYLSQGDTGRWQPKLIDFGVARLVDLGGRDKITRRGMVVGTPVYMALEQIQGAEADERSDVWALAAVLCETMAGVLPFEGPGLAAHIALLFANTPARACEDDALWAILQRGLARQADRWPSARAMGKALAAWLWSRGVTTDVTGVSLRARWLDDDDIRRIARPPVTSETATARFPAPASIAQLAAPSAAPADPSREPARESEVDPARSTSAEIRSSAPASDAAPIPPARSRPRFVGIALLALLACAAAALLFARSERTPAPATTVSAPEPAAPAPSASASASTVPAASSSEPVAPPSASSAPSPQSPRRRAPPAPTLPRGLKDPFH